MDHSNAYHEVDAIYGIVGHPLTHSYSQILHSYALKSFKLNGRYLNFDHKLSTPDEARSFLRAFRAAGGKALNITAPYKELFARAIECEHYGSINTIYLDQNDQWQGCSTDGPGFLSAVRRLSGSLNYFKSIVFLSNGGATLAIVEHLYRTSQLTMPCYILRRNASRDQNFMNIAKHNPKWHFDTFNPATLENLLVDPNNQPTLVVQASSAPHLHDDLHQFNPALLLLKGAFIDLCYRPASSCLQQCQSLGIPSQDGKIMLVEQARCCHKIWWGQTIGFESLMNIISQA